MRIPIRKHVNGLILLLCAMMLAACSGEDDNADIATRKAIGFECHTKGVKTTANDMQFFRVSAIWAKGDSKYEWFMNNQLVERDGTSWAYSPTRYWPSHGSVSFFAYSPAISSGLQLPFVVSDTDNKVTFDYKVPTDNDSQEDFLVATSLEKTDNPVHLQFEHALASARFWIRSIDANSSFRINKITLKNLNSTGTLTGTAIAATTSWAWSDISTPDNYSIEQKYPLELQTTTHIDVGSLMVLPQIISNSFEIEITYNNTETTTHTLSSGFEFEMGKKYSFYIDMQ